MPVIWSSRSGYPTNCWANIRSSPRKLESAWSTCQRYGTDPSISECFPGRQCSTCSTLPVHRHARMIDLSLEGCFKPFTRRQVMQLRPARVAVGYFR